MDYNSDLHEPRTNAEQSETGGDFRVSFESRRLPDTRLLRRGRLDDIECAKIYFIYGAGLIKIGVTTKVDARLRSLELSSPVGLVFLGMYPGTRSDEFALHKRFAHLRRHGEWFNDTEEIRAFIEERVDPCWHRQPQITREA